VSWIVPIAGGVRLRVRVQPRASRTELVGPVGDQLRIRLAAPPVEGAANDALVRFVAQTLGIRRAAVILVAGASSRSKVVELSGMDEVAVRTRLGLAGN
jgi:uncharacterized protein (TIGR00251 family)